MNENVATTTSYSSSANDVARAAFTVEHLAYVVVIVLAAGLRFFGLGEQVMQPFEAAQSWPAWLAAVGLSAPNTPVPDSALLFSLQSALFWLTQGSDGLARAVSAVAGTLMVLTPWIMRGWLGRTSALLLALLLAIDPWLVAFSRLADGAILSVALTLLALAALMRISMSDVAPDSRRGWLVWIALAAGLLLVSGPLGWSFLPVLLLFALIFTLPALGEQGVNQLRGKSLSLLAIFVGAALLGSTGWLARPQSLGYVSRSVGVWLAQIEGGEYPLIWTLLRLLVDQPFGLVFGACGFILLWRRRTRTSARPALPSQSWPIFLTGWLAWGIVWQLLPGRTPQALLVLGLPLLFAAAYAGAALLAAAPKRINWLEAGVLLALMTIIWISGRILLNSLVSSEGFDVTLALVSLLMVMVVLLLISAFSLWSEWLRVRWFLGIFVAVWLLIATLSSALQLAHVHDPSHPNALFANASHPAARVLVHDVQALSAQRRGDPTELALQVQMAPDPDPLLGWYLRDMRRLSWALSPQADGNGGRSPLLITMGTVAENAPGDYAEQLALPAGFIGSDYRVRYHWLPDQLVGDPMPETDLPADAGPLARVEPQLDAAWRRWARPTLRWVLYREASAAPDTVGVVLWTEQSE